MVPKFRAWHMPFGKKGPMQEMVYRKASSILAFAEMTPDKYIVEQYTGLKDANGKEIYEGDVIHAIREDGYDRTGKILFEEGSYMIHNGMDKCLMNPMCGEFILLEVIGNVHENPELLEAQHDTRTD